MNLLLDTHAFLWFVSGDSRITGKARSAVEASENIKLVSIASFWEIGIKTSLGKLVLGRPFEVLIPGQMETNGFDLLHIEISHIEKVISLPFHHRDPFDRMLAAQCLADDFSLVSRDEAFDSYGVSRIW